MRNRRHTDISIDHISLVGTCMDSQPRRNLGPRWNIVDAEEAFANAFVKAYNRKYFWIHNKSSRQYRAMAREVPVNGFGIADLVTVSSNIPLVNWSHEKFSEVMRPTVRAFEFKLSDWRRGMMQAHRYRFFADASILVIPATKIHLANSFLNTFRAINVGLWGFDQLSEVISPIFTPRPKSPVDTDHRNKAILKVLDATMQDQPVF